MNNNKNGVSFLLCLLIFIGCASSYHGPVSSVSRRGPIMLPQIQIDTIQFLSQNISGHNLGPIGGTESLKALISYPEIARGAGVSGKVSIKLHVNTKGKTDSSIILHSDNELFDQPSLDGVKRARYFPSVDSGTAGYSIIVNITFSVINIEQISIEHRKWRSGPFSKLTIENNESCVLTKTIKGEEPVSYTGSIDRREYYLAATAIRNQILMIPNSFYDPKNDSTIIITYTENGKTSTYAGSVDNYDYNYFWAIDAILDKTIKEIHWYETPEE